MIKSTGLIIPNTLLIIRPQQERPPYNRTRQAESQGHLFDCIT